MRLTDAALSGYAGPGFRPGYDRAEISAGIVHIGIGAFHRAHQAAYVDTALAKDPSWGIRAISMRSPDTLDRLGPQDFLYTLAERGAAGISARVIGAVMSIEVGPGAAVAAVADPSIRLLTLTVTEKGYTPTLAATISSGLARRAEIGAGPLTILSCDNLSDNGRVTETLVRSATKGRAVGQYLDQSVRFPSCMVDRITPATTAQDCVEVSALTGLEDAWPVVTEPFSQWVIEDNFADERPPLPGVDWVADVAPYEEAKLRLLNGAHTTLAMLGPMLGHRYVADAVADPVLRCLIDGTARHEVFPHLSLGAAVLAAYWQALLERFDNPALNHSLTQIASDTSQKIPQRLVAPLLDARRSGRNAPGLVLAIAAWLERIRRETCAGRALHDPLADWLAKLAPMPPEAALETLCGAKAPLHALTPDLITAVLAAHQVLDGKEGAALADCLRKYIEAHDA
ncbi:mannitol dehydrogenase family protein [Ruegeria sp. HKCCD8929]|uniref:mannitol dehydrogenase family protein n=1 Tax=Ruegeria sp. HKCCD8929 TaxID=2683006 RepID=UPI001488F76E|nr:mannitol dehydrogenase family protein [Ruegeria sp. HKCCD8929]